MENQRIRLSKAMLKNALMGLLKEKPIEKISVYELCAAAQINRTTFYKYYGSQYELLTDAENDYFRKLEDVLSENASDGRNSLCRVLEALLDGVIRAEYPNEKPALLAAAQKIIAS